MIVPGGGESCPVRSRETTHGSLSDLTRQCTVYGMKWHLFSQAQKQVRGHQYSRCECVIEALVRAARIMLHYIKALVARKLGKTRKYHNIITFFFLIKGGTVCNFITYQNPSIIHHLLKWVPKNRVPPQAPYVTMGESENKGKAPPRFRLFLTLPRSITRSQKDAGWFKKVRGVQVEFFGSRFAPLGA
jgi:hypothetical protein